MTVIASSNYAVRVLPQLPAALNIAGSVSSIGTSAKSPAGETKGSSIDSTRDKSQTTSEQSGQQDIQDMLDAVRQQIDAMKEASESEMQTVQRPGTASSSGSTLAQTVAAYQAY